MQHLLNTVQQGQQHDVHAEACGGDIAPLLDGGAPLQHGGNVQNVECHGVQNEHTNLGL